MTAARSGNISTGAKRNRWRLAGAAVALAGFNNAAERRFRERDWICVNGLIEGTVESVDLRSTLERRFDKAPVYVPNSELANNLLINFSRCPHRRISWKLSLTYNSFNDSSIDMLVLFSQSNVWGDYVEASPEEESERSRHQERSELETVSRARSRGRSESGDPYEAADLSTGE